MKILYLPIEIFDRELPSKLLLAIEAISKDFIVYIFDQHDFKANLTQLLPGAVLHKDHADCNAYHIFKEAKQLGFTTCALDEEGLVYFNEEHFARARIGQACMKVTDIVFAWGPDQYKILQKNIHNQQTEIACTGNPRFDLHVANREKRGAYTNKNKVLINTRFGSVNSGLGLDVDGYIDRMRSMDEVKTPEDELFRRNYFVFMGVLYEEFISLINQLAQSLPEHEFTIRPHPAESSKPYIRLAEQYSNVKVSSSKSLEDDLLQHDLLVHNGCTTGIEALITNIPTIVYEPIPAPEGDMALPNHFGDSYQSIDDVVEAIRSNKPYNFKAELEKMESYISSLELADSHKKIIKAIDDKMPACSDEKAWQNVTIKGDKLRALKNLITLVPDTLLNSYLRDKKLRWEFVAKKFPIISAEELSGRVKDLVNNQKYIKFDINPNEITCKKVSAKGFVLSRKA